MPVRPIKHVLDNEASKDLKIAIQENYKIQLLPPENKIANIAEWAIQSFKTHMTAELKWQ